MLINGRVSGNFASRLARVVAFWCAASLLPSICTAADLITFDTTPTGAVPKDNSTLSTPYNLSGGGTVSFFFDDNQDNVFDAGDEYPKFEQAGSDDPNSAFVSQWLHNGDHDTPRPGYEAQLGTFMLRKPTSILNGPLPGPFIAAYNTTQTITQFSGEIWDIDGNDQWQVDALGTNAQILATQISPKFGNTNLDSLDSLPWQFQFTNLPPGVKSVRLSYLGVNSDKVGLSFNNFSPTFAVPLAGDYNRDGVVDINDYILWRDTLGSTTNLSADGNGNHIIDTGDYIVWRANFDRPFAGGAGSLAAQVPEPSCLVLLSLLLATRTTSRSRR